MTTDRKPLPLATPPAGLTPVGVSLDALVKNLRAPLDLPRPRGPKLERVK